MDTLEVINKRFSCRSFKDEKITKEELNKILEAAHMAPTACNLQPVRLFVVESEEMLNKLALATRFTFGSKTIIVVGYDENESWVRRSDNKNHGEIDATIAATEMVLAGYSMGIGSCYVCAYKDDILRDVLEVPSNIKLTCMLPFGYPVEFNKPNTRKDLSEIVTYK